MKKKCDYTIGSGNVFNDLGLPEEAKMIEKAEKHARKMIKLHKGNGKPQKLDFNKLCLDYIKKTFLKITPRTVQKGSDQVDRG